MDDLISREDAVELCDWYEHEFEECEYALRALADDIRALPNAERRGKWIERHHSYSDEEKPIEEWQSARCSVCGKYHTTPYLYYFDEYKFCPNCGARMERSEE